MSNYPQSPAGSTPKPRSVALAVNLIWVAVALTLVSTALGLAQIDEAVATALEGDTTGTLTESAARAGIIAFIVIFLVLGVALYALLAFLITRGKNWARIVFTGLGTIFLLLGMLGLGADQTAVSLLLALAQLAVTAATLFFLWTKESSAWFSASGRRAS